MKENLEESEERYRLSAIGSNDALWDWTYATHELHFSDRWFEMTGYDRENDISRNIEAIVHPEDKELYRKALRDHLEDTIDHFPLRGAHPDSVRKIHVGAVPRQNRQE